ncbi:MAG: GDP-mannose 4,6-dehydratase, partial [Nanoarchaeota archaeon]|nr:GDP-mannose 4,6-dehydratase [Nanoarchaeota archaeon]
MKTLVACGAGFLGSYVCERLVQEGNEVYCIDNLSSGNFDNIMHLQKNPSNFHFAAADVLHQKEFPKADYIFHMASLASPDYYQKEPVKTIEINTLGTKMLLEHARKNDSGFLFASTSEVYGDAQVIPTPEDYWGSVNPNGIRSCYDEGKRCGEAYCKAYEREYGMDVRIARI